MTQRLSRMNMRADEETEQSGGTPPFKRILILVVFLIIVSAIVFLLIHFLGGKSAYTGYRITNTLEFNSTGSVDVVSYEGGTLRVSRDGAEAADSDGKQLWNVAYSMKKPVVKVLGRYAAVGDKNGSLLYIMDGTGTVNPVNTPHPIVDIEVAQQGVTAVWTNDGVDDHIYIYSISGEELVDIETKAVKDGFPVDIALSPDGTRMVTSYVTLDSVHMESWVTFYNFGSVGQSYVDKIVGTFSYENDVVPYVEFIDSEYVLVGCTDKIDIYRIKEIPELHAQITPEHDIISVFDAGEAIGVVSENSAIPGEYIIESYGINGAENESFKLEGAYSGIASAGDNVLLYGAGWFGLYSWKGELIFRTSLEGEVVKVLASDAADEFFVVGADRINFVRLTQDES